MSANTLTSSYILANPNMALLPSRPREFHPEPLTEPDVILSHHPAHAIARRLPPSASAAIMVAKVPG